MSQGKRLALAKGVNFGCRQCGDCCREFPVSLSSAEVQRLESRDWTPVLGKVGPVVKRVRSGGRTMAYLARGKDGACIFLGDDALCEIHRNFGEPEKPLACRMFPFRVADGPAVSEPVVGGHFACSALARGEGPSLPQRRDELTGLVKELHTVQPPITGPDGLRLPFHGTLSYRPQDTSFVLDLAADIFEAKALSFEQRLVALIKFLSLVHGSKFQSFEKPNTRKAVTSFAQGTREHVKRGLLNTTALTPLPQRLLFRSILAFAARRDPASLLTAGVLRRLTRRVGNLLAGITFMAGTGKVRCIGRERQVVVGDVRRHAPPADLSSSAADATLTRYFLGQISGRFLHAPTFLVPETLPAFGLLVRQFPLILLFARAACLAREGDALNDDDWACAVRTADWNFGRVPWTSGVIGGVRANLLSDLEAGVAFATWCATPPVRVDEAPPADAKAP